VAATEDMPRHCWDGSGGRGRVAGGACRGVGGVSVAGRVMELAGVLLRCWDRRAMTGVLRHCLGSVGRAALRDGNQGKGGGRQWRSACVGVRPLTGQLALHVHNPGGRFGGDFESTYDQEPQNLSQVMLVYLFNAAIICLWTAYQCAQTFCICLIWMWEAV
jgi:hypothetical protein